MWITVWPRPSNKVIGCTLRFLWLAPYCVTAVVQISTYKHPPPHSAQWNSRFLIVNNQARFIISNHFWKWLNANPAGTNSFCGRWITSLFGEWNNEKVKFKLWGVAIVLLLVSSWQWVMFVWSCTSLRRDADKAQTRQVRQVSVEEEET